MKAAIGDQIIVDGTRGGSDRLDGEVIGLHHPDGTPPFDVRWSDSGSVSVFFPGPDTRVLHFGHAAPGEPAGVATVSGGS
jgi:hypothetical protein